jgi:hypothetical protein
VVPASYVKLSCSVPISGVSGYLLISLRGECADLQDNNRSHEPSQEPQNNTVAHNNTKHVPVHVPLAGLQFLWENNTVALR